MTSKPAHPLSDDELHPLVDDQGTPQALAALQTRLAHDPLGQARLLQWQRQRDALRGLHAQVLAEPVPAALLQAGQRTSGARHTGQQGWRYGALAASVLLSFAAGWLGNANWAQSAARLASRPLLGQAQLDQNFVRQASLAHGVYVPEVLHPVEVSALQQAHLVQWLSKRLGKPLKVPDLTAQGFTLMGGRLLPGDTSVRAQFMFQNTAGRRITLYLGAVSHASPPGLSDKETRFSYASQNGIPSFYWVDQGFGYALAGQLPREVLMQLADSVYHQL
ncbi:hypothetical protein GALL_485860 [mine drainage metagenome]|uniref:Transmembrane transcriptional regulator (Anti-sigma factor) n=1 Tax=mine drainage metagenome TaxID=410659 RepID=A0A1J5PWX4_9ZZZZ